LEICDVAARGVSVRIGDGLRVDAAGDERVVRVDGVVENDCRGIGPTIRDRDGVLDLLGVAGIGLAVAVITDQGVDLRGP
jgi:hypothetical protein